MGARCGTLTPRLTHPLPSRIHDRHHSQAFFADVLDMWKDNKHPGGSDEQDLTLVSGIRSVPADYARLAWRQSSECSDRETQALVQRGVRVMEKTRSVPVTISKMLSGNSERQVGFQQPDT